MAKARSYPKQVRVILHGLENGYPRGGMSIEGGDVLPGGIYKASHAADFLMREGWPPGTLILFRNDHLDHDSFLPMTLEQAAQLGRPGKPKDTTKVAKAPWVSEARDTMATVMAAQSVQAQSVRLRPSSPSRRTSPTGSARTPLRPRQGGKCAAVWELCDGLLSASGGIPERKAVIAAAEAAGMNAGNAGIEYGKWKKWQVAQ